MQVANHEATRPSRIFDLNQTDLLKKTVALGMFSQLPDFICIKGLRKALKL